MGYTGSGPADAAVPLDTARVSQLKGHAQDVLAACGALGQAEGVAPDAHSVSCSIGMLPHLARPRVFQRMILIAQSPRFLNHSPGYRGGFEEADLHGLLDLMHQNDLGWASYLAPVVAGGQGNGPVPAQLEGSFCSTDPARVRVYARVTFWPTTAPTCHGCTAPA